jgi:SAM-dependent methyltransferase
MYMRYLVIGSISPVRFLETGRNQFRELMLPLLQRNGYSLDQFETVMDFGCGCGRILRQLEAIQHGELWGVDTNPSMIDWCHRNLPFANFQVSAQHPPLGFGSETLHFVYARSVFTHLDQPAQDGWLQELTRVMIPAGVLLFTVCGDQFLTYLSADELQRYRRGELVVRNGEKSGTNGCITYHPPSYVGDLLRRYGLTIRDVVPGGQIPDAVQDTYLVTKAR